jgi:KAP family P-loop domain
LKEVMDVPGFSFVCGFDPLVVGKVLRARHRGFGDGLKFLEKIIDYPVWLPPATTEGLLKMALADAKAYCSFVPESGIRNSMPLLPQNPRAIRQFVRLLSLLKNQITRHYETELRWSVILPVAVIRTRYPKLATVLLCDLGFLRGIGMRNTLERETAEGKKVDAEVEQHILKAAISVGVTLDDTSRKELHDAMRRITNEVNLWLGTDVETITYLASIAERPRALTLKEFDELLGCWSPDPSREGLAQWIASHAKSQHRTDAEVAREITERSVDRYLLELRQADDAFTSRARVPYRAAAKFQLNLMEVLLLYLPTTNDSLRSRNWIPVESIFKRLPPMADAISGAHRESWPRTRALLIQLVKGWSDDIEPLMRVIKPLDPFMSSRIDGKENRRFLGELGKTLVKRFASSLTEKFAEPSFIENVRSGEDEGGDVTALLFSADGPLWKGETREILGILRRAKRNPSVQENAYAILDWIEYLLRKMRGFAIEKEAAKFVADPVAFPAIWAAATAVRFAGRYAYRMQNLGAQLKSLGVEVKLPRWWDAALAELNLSQEESGGSNSSAE